jgi:hypothetical protein
MGRIHVCDACAVPYDDPEDQMVVAIGREGLGFHRGHRQRTCPGRPPSGIGRVERSNLMRASLHPKLQTRCSGETVRIIRLED